METVPIIGGTGALGFGLALRWAQAGVPIVIGSRKQESADEAAQRVREKVPGRAGRGRRERRGGEARPDRRADRPVPRAVGEPDQPEGAPAARARSWSTRRCRWRRRSPARRRACSASRRGRRASRRRRWCPTACTVVSALHTVSAATLGDLDHALDEDIPIAGDKRDAQAAGRGADREDRRAAADQRRAARGGAPDRGADAAADRRQRAPQDPRGHQVHGAARAQVVVVLAGGTGGAKLAAGMLDVVGPGRADASSPTRPTTSRSTPRTSPPTRTSSPGGWPA